MRNTVARSAFPRASAWAVACAAYLLLLTAVPAAAQSAAPDTSLPPRVTFDSRFVSDLYSSPAIERFGVELLDLAHWPVQRLLPPADSTGAGVVQWDGPGRRNLLHGLTALAGGAFVGTAFTHAYHEFGHGSRVAAIGLRPWYTHDPSASDASGAPIRGSGASDNCFGYLLTSLGDRSGFTYARLDRTRFALNTQALAAGWDGLNAMAGLNNEMEFAAALDQRTERPGGHLGFLMPYLAAKLSARSYALGDGQLNDVSNILAFYAAQGFAISHNDIRQGSAVAALASANTYRLAYAGLRTLTGRRSEFSPSTAGPLELPSTSFFLNRKGLSYRVGTAVRRGAVRIPVAMERVFSGDTRTEWTVGVDLGRGATSVSARVVARTGLVLVHGVVNI